MIDLDELMRLHAAATPGPWKIGAWNGIVAESPRGVEWDKALFSVALNAEKTAKADAAYICKACNAVPELVQRIRELEAQLSKQSFKQVSALEPCRIVSNNNSTPPEWLMRRFTEVK